MKIDACIAIALLAAAGCTKNGAAAAAGPRPAIPVTAAVVAERAAPIRIHALAHATAHTTVSLRPEVSGVLSAVHFREGQDVKKGDKLFSVDARTFQSSLRIAQAERERDVARLHQAEDWLKRLESVKTAGAVTEDALSKARSDVDAAKASVEYDDAKIEMNRLDVERCEILAPCDARTGPILCYPGNVVKQHDDPVMVVLYQIRPIDVLFTVAEKYIPLIREHRASGDLAVELKLTDGGPPLRGDITFIDSSVEAGTGTIKLKASFANEDVRLLPGQYLEAALLAAPDARAIAVPTEAVTPTQNGPAVFVVNADQSAELRLVTPGRVLGRETVIEKGLAAGETIVIDGQVRLVPGAKVEAKMKQAAGPESRP